MRPGLTAAVGFGAVAGALSAMGAGVWTLNRRISREVAELFGESPSAARGELTESDLEALPEPVQRWLRWTGSGKD